RRVLGSRFPPVVPEFLLPESEAPFSRSSACDFRSFPNWVFSSKYFAPKNIPAKITNVINNLENLVSLAAIVNDLSFDFIQINYHIDWLSLLFQDEQ